MRIKRIGVNCLVVIILSSILLGCYSYIKSVKTSLWMQNAEQTLEITSQGGHAFEMYITIEQDRVHSLANKMSEIESHEDGKILNNLNLLGGETSNYTVVDLDKGIFYSNRLDERRLLSMEELEFYRTFSGKGIRENYLNLYDGQNTMGVYECFLFADGAHGLMQKGERVSALSKEFSISFYNESGFSYITNQDGDVLIRPYHKNSNRTFSNLFDVIAEENDEENLRTFKESLANGHSGVIQFSFNGAENIVTFSPIKVMDGWYIISVIPSSVIMEYTDYILQSSQIFIFAVFIVFFIGLIFLLFERQSRKRIEKKEQDIQYREQLFSILSENIDDVFLMLNSESYMVEYVTPNVNRVLGISPDAVAASLESLGKATYTEEKTISYSDLALMKPGQSIIMESERTHRNTGEKRWFYETVYRVGEGQSDKFIVVLSDRTKERQNKFALETALNAANAANKAKSTFLNNISHDIRTPMNAIVGLTVLLNHDDGDPKRVKEYTRKITASSQYLLGLINDVLDMSKIESGKTTLNVTEINLAELIDELGTMIRPQTKAKQQEFELFLADVTMEHLIGDRMRINQVLINILSNAVKYTPVGGRIQMTVTQLPQKTKDFVRLRFEVQDNGIGMSEDFLHVIFEPFAREINSVTNQIQGTGLGMPITKNLVELMGGTIDVKSRQGEGSIFTVDLELRIQEQNVDEKFWENHGITRVLVVDDDESICINVIRVMEDTGVSVRYALGGDDAIRQIGEAHQEGIRFDLVLLDWKMPGMDGIQTARKIRAMLPEHIPILLLTAYEWDEIDEPQMTKEQIRVLYRKLSADFSTQPIEQVRERCQEIAKKYFSCFPLLYQIGSLYVNNSTLVENKNMAIKMLEDASRLFERVKSETDNVDLAKQALNMEALCQLTLGNPKEVLTLLGEPDFSMTSTEPLLASTYHLLGNKKEARSILQVGIFQHTVVLINLLSIYLGLCLDRAEIFEETDRRAFAIAEAFNLNKLHPAIILPLYFTIAQGYMKLGEPEKTLEILEQYTQLACSNIYPLNLHGDEYFDLLDGWLENTLTLGSDMPRNQMMMQKSVSESIINCKTFESLKDNAQFQNILKRLKALEKNH